MTDNYCYQPLGGNKAIDISTGMPTYGLYPVTPGAITLLSTGQGAESVAPSPSLVVDEPSISYLVPLASPSPQSVAGGSTSPSTSPSPPPGAPSEKSASSRTSVNSLVVPIVLVFVILCLMN
jgi:hypothetical protein